MSDQDLVARLRERRKTIPDGYLYHPEPLWVAAADVIEKLEVDVAFWRVVAEERKAETDRLTRERDDALSTAGVTHGVYPELYALRAECDRLRAALEKMYGEHRMLTFHSPRMKHGECDTCDSYREALGEKT